MRLSRKIKKGCRTLSGRPRTKWQRKGQLHIARLFENIVNTACVAAVGMNLLRQTAESIRSVKFPPGGIIVPPQPMVGESTGEIVLHRPQLDRLKHVVMSEPVDCVFATLSVDLQDTLEKIRHCNINR